MQHAKSCQKGLVTYTYPGEIGTVFGANPNLAGAPECGVKTHNKFQIIGALDVTIEMLKVIQSMKITFRKKEKTHQRLGEYHMVPA
jgi:hypothetical protein